MLDTALEQLGGQPVVGQKAPPTQPTGSQTVSLQQLKAIDKASSGQQVAQITKQLEEEIKKYRLIREEQLRQRRELDNAAGVEAAEPPVVPPASKPKRGLFGIKTAQQKAGAETGPARRTSG